MPSMKLALAWIGAALLAVGSSAAAQTAPYATDRIAVVGAKVFPSPDEPPIEDSLILIDAGRITSVGLRGSTPVPKGYRVIDETGHSITTGFWNSHVHLTTPVLLRASAAPDAALQAELEKDFTRWGFTTIFDLASTTAIATEVKGRIETGRVLGPRLLSVGEPFYPPAATPIYARPFYEAYKLPSAEIRSPTETAARADRQIGAGDDGVKLFTGSIVGGAEDVIYMQAEAVRAITDGARRRGKPSFAHPTDRKGLELAVSNGVGILAHSAPLMGPWSADYATWIAAKDVALVPTLALFADAANPDTPVTTALQQTMALHDAGGIVLFGTDVGFNDAFDTSTDMKMMRQA
ncbi:MAG: hypothetical protein JWR77_487, partial [Rhizorhabdus sp.]|nr:hypothetical protein [Rhizorhabdus sp.]